MLSSQYYIWMQKKFQHLQPPFRFAVGRLWSVYDYGNLHQLVSDVITVYFLNSCHISLRYCQKVYLLIILDRDVTKAVGMKNMSKNPTICL